MAQGHGQQQQQGMPPSTPNAQTGFGGQMGMPTNINASALLGKRKERTSTGGAANAAGGAQGSPGNGMRNKRQNTDGGAGQGMNLGGMMPGQQGMGPAAGQSMQPPQGMNGNVPQQQQLPQSIPMPTNFPFDPRLLPYIQALSNPSTVEIMRQNQPGFFASLVKANDMLRSGAVEQDTLASMQKYVQQVAILARAHQQQAAQQPQQQQQQHQQPPPQQQQQQQQQMPPPNSTPVNGASGRKGLPDVKSTKSPAGSAKKEDKKRSHKAKQPKKNAAAEVRQREPTAGSPMPGGESFKNASAGPSVLLPPIPAPPPPVVAPSLPTLPPPPAYEPVPIESWQKYRHPTLPIMHLQRIPDELDEMKDPTLDGAILPLSDRIKSQMRTWMDRDIDYASAWEVQRKEMGERMQQWRVAQKPAWWEHDKRLPKARRPMGLDLIWPVDKNNQRDKKRMNGKHMALRL